LSRNLRFTRGALHGEVRGISQDENPSTRTAHFVAATKVSNTPVRILP
jgi:hypothetical protein